MKRQIIQLTSLLAALLMTLAVQAETKADPATVILDENPTTGYAWHYTAGPEGLLNEVSSQYAQAAATQGKMGAGGKRTWVFEGAVPGDVTLLFAYARPFEEGIAPERTITFAFRVTEDLQAAMRGRVEIAGSQILVTLPENPTTGYVWVGNIDSQDILTPLGDTYLPDEVPQGLVGAGGMHTWQFEATAAGEAILRFTLERSWEPGAIDEISFTFAVDESLAAALLAGQ